MFESGSLKHLVSAEVNYAIFETIPSLNCKQILSNFTILSLKSSLFSGKGWALSLEIRAWMNTSDSYLLNSLAVNSFSKMFNVISLLIYMRSLRVCTKFLPRFVFKNTRSWISLGDLNSSLFSVSNPDLRILRSGSTRQFIGLCKFKIRLVYSSLSIQKQTKIV